MEESHHQNSHTVVKKIQNDPERILYGIYVYLPWKIIHCCITECTEERLDDDEMDSDHPKW